MLGPRRSALYDSVNVIPVNTVEEMMTRVKSYIDLEIAMEMRKMHKETKKKVQEMKRPKQHPLKPWTDDHKCCPLLQHPRWEVYETFTPLS